MAIHRCAVAYHPVSVISPGARVGLRGSRHGKGENRQNNKSRQQARKRANHDSVSSVAVYLPRVLLFSKAIAFPSARTVGRRPSCRGFYTPGAEPGKLHPRRGSSWLADAERVYGAVQVRPSPFPAAEISYPG